jgi:hypothetical protein
MSDHLDELGLKWLAHAIVERLDVHTPLLEDIHAACCEESDGPSPLVEELRFMREAINRQTAALEALTAELHRRPG